jgi:hypothetical protein
MSAITQTQTPAANPFAGVTVQASGSEPLPSGAYIAEFVNVEPFAHPTDPKLQNKLKWRWKVASGNHTGREATALTDPVFKPTTHAGRLLAGLVGRPLVPGEDVGELWNTLQQQIGKRFTVTVGQGPKGGKPTILSVNPPLI